MRLRGAMGLCVKAGQAVFGTDGCLNEIRSGQCGILLVSEESSPGAKDKFSSACQLSGVEMVVIPCDMIHQATGRPGIAMAVKKGGFSTMISGIISGKTAEQHSSKSKKQGNKFGGVNV